MNHNRLALLENQAFALMGRMHVILRRQNGRVTDIEYMRINPDYCRYLLDMASQLPNEDLQQICMKLQDIYFGPEGLFVMAPPNPPLLARVSASATPQPLTQEIRTAPATVPHPGHGVEIDKTYIGRLR